MELAPTLDENTTILQKYHGETETVTSLTFMLCSSSCVCVGRDAVSSDVAFTCLNETCLEEQYMRPKLLDFFVASVVVYVFPICKNSCVCCSF